MAKIYCKGCHWHKPRYFGRPSRYPDLCLHHENLVRIDTPIEEETAHSGCNYANKNNDCQLFESKKPSWKFWA